MSEVEKVGENLDGAVVEEIGSPDGDHVEYVDDDMILEPDVAFVHDGEIVNDDLEDEDDEVTDDEPVIEEVESQEEVVDGERAEASPDEDAEDTPEGAPEASDEGASPEAQDAREAFTLNVDGQSYDVPEAYVDGDNIVIPRDSFQRVIQPRVADRSVWQKERQQYEQRIQDLNPENNPQVVKAKTLLDNMLEVLEDDDKAEEFFSDFVRQRDKLILQAERAELEAEKNNLTSSQKREDAATQAEELPKQMDASIGAILNEAKNIDQYASVDMDYVRELIEPIKASFFFRAEQDMPDAGLKKGEIGVRIDLLEQVVAKEASRAQALQATQQTRERNQEALNDSADDDASAPPALEPDNPIDVREPPKVESKEDWDAHMAAIAAGR